MPPGSRPRLLRHCSLLQAFAQIGEDFPVSTRMLLENLQRAAQQKVDGEFARAGLSHLLTPELLQAFQAAALAGGGGGGGGGRGGGGSGQPAPAPRQVGVSRQIDGAEECRSSGLSKHVKHD
jgi:hypothetical protein